MSTEYKDNIGGRVLIDWGINGVLEARIIEVSPSGKWAKIKAERFTDWVEAWNHEIKEVLNPVPPAP